MYYQKVSLILIIRNLIQLVTRNIRYYNKLTCERYKCTVSKFKEADFSKDDPIKAVDARKNKNVHNSDTNNPRSPGG